MQQLLFVLLAAAGVVLAQSSDAAASSYGPAMYSNEIAYLSSIGARLTGSNSHYALMNRIQSQLTAMGLKVYSNTYSFEYEVPSKSGPSLTVGSTTFNVSSAYPYSGSTGTAGITGKLVWLDPALLYWPLAAGAIAVVPITNLPVFFAGLAVAWNISQEFQLPIERNPVLALATLPSLSGAVAAGVKAVVFAWDHQITDDNALNQYLPFNGPLQGIPTLYTSGATSDNLIAQAFQGSSATLNLATSYVENRTTRTMWAVVNGTTKPNQSIITLTHTDGINVVEENGHIGVLQLAQDAVNNPPQRTHIFLFGGAHFRTPAIGGLNSASARWLNDNPVYWQGGQGQMKAVAGLGIEHMGAVQYADNLVTNTYAPTGSMEFELLYATTPSVAGFAFQNWVGANQSLTLPVRPILPIAQFGEGAGLTGVGIPNLSLVTGPLYLVKNVSDASLVNVAALTRQVQSFQRVRQVMDAAPTGWTGTL